MQANINLTTKQTEAWEVFEDPNITELGFGGGAGGGKSKLLCYFAIYMAERYPGSRGAIGRKELKTLRFTTMQTFWETMAELGFKESVDYQFDAKDGVVRFSNGSQLMFLDTAYSPQDPEYTRFGSLELTWCGIDESAETPLKAKQILKTRIGRKNKVHGEEVKQFWYESFNPDKGHVYTDYYKPYKEGTMPAYRVFIPSLAQDNPYLPENYITQLKRSDKTTKERLLYGNFDYEDDPANLFEHDAVTDLFTNAVDNGQKYLVADIARFGQDKTVVGIWDGQECKEIKTYDKIDTELQATRIKELLVENRIPYSKCLIDEDGIGGGVIDNLKGVKGFMGNSSPFQVWDTRKAKMVNANFKNLRSQCYFLLADYVNTHRLAIRSEDEELKERIRQELEAHKQKNMDKDNANQVLSKDEIKEALGFSPDYADMLMMRMFFEYTKKAHRTTKTNDPLRLTRPNTGLKVNKTTSFE